MFYKSHVNKYFTWNLESDDGKSKNWNGENRMLIFFSLKTGHLPIFPENLKLF